MEKKLNIVSHNYKTRWSINTNVEESCFPTPICYEVCYGRRGRLTTKNSIRRQRAVLKVFKKEDPELIANVLAYGYRKRHLSFLRWNGVGDCIPEMVRVINILGREYQDTIHFVPTRKPTVIKQLEFDMPNVYVGYSLDNSYESKRRQAEVKKVKHPRVFYSFLRQSAEQDIRGAQLIFDLHTEKGKLPYDPKRSCPVDAGKMDMMYACEKCGKCFSPRILKDK